MKEDIKNDLVGISFTHPYFSGIVNNVLSCIKELEAENKTSKEAINILTNKLEKVVEENKELKQENKGHEEEIGRLEYNYEKALDDLIKYEKTLKNLQKETIWKSKVREKIEELNRKINDIPDGEGDFSKAILIRAKITLQELLEEE